MSTGRLAMARSGQSRHAPKRAKQATRSSGAFIGLRNYRRVGRGHATRGRWGRRTAGGGGSVAPGQEALGEQGLKGLLELRGHRVCHLVGPSRSLHPLAVSPALEIGVLLCRALAHGEGVDEVLEPLGELTLACPVALGGLDQRGNVLPVHDAVTSHGRRGRFYRNDPRLLDKDVPHPYPLLTIAFSDHVTTARSGGP